MQTDDDLTSCDKEHIQLSMTIPGPCGEEEANDVLMWSPGWVARYTGDVCICPWVEEEAMLAMSSSWAEECDR